MSERVTCGVVFKCSVKGHKHRTIEEYEDCLWMAFQAGKLRPLSQYDEPFERWVS